MSDTNEPDPSSDAPAGARASTGDARPADPPPPPSAGGGHAPPPVSTRRLRRSTHDRKIAGVAGGLGEYLGIDPVLVRVLFVLAVLAGGSGIVAYAVAWLVIPDHDGTTPVGPARPDTPSGRAGGDAGRIVGGVLLVAALLIAIDGWWRVGDLLFPLALIAGGAWLLLRDRGDGSSDQNPPPPEPRVPDHAWEQTTGTTATLTPQPIAEVRPKGIPTGQITFGIVAVAAGLLGVLAANGVEVGLATGLLITLGITATGLLVGAFTGRARGLIALAVPLVLVLGLVSALDLHLDRGVGERTYAPLALDAVDGRYEHGVGRLEIDLTDLPADELVGARRTVEISHGVGLVLVRVPPQVTVEVDATVRLGDAVVFGERREGTDLVERTVRRGEEGRGVFVLQIDLGVGEVEVR